ncbi:hypothetical protein F5Y03DRAFT_400942 [Xylaria venustula]|nr:hypothetical protein F5Y03DRAFT_400942 [Xylaria venustula]
MPRPQPVDRRFTLDLSPYIKRFSEQIDARWPALTKAQIDIISQRAIPQVGQHITADLRWSQNDLRILDQSDMSDPTKQHENTVSDPDFTSGKTLYKICLRVWHMFPTNIICPATGLVYGTQKAGAIQSNLIEMRWPKTFNETLIEVLVNSFWGYDFYLLVHAIKFTCICAVDDRRPWHPESHGDPFFEAFLACQERNPTASKREIIEPIEEELMSRLQWPSKAFKVFESIAEPYMAAKRKLGNDEDEYEDYEAPLAGELPWHLNTVRTEDLKRLLRALDMIETNTCFPLPSGAQKEIFIHARPQSKAAIRDEPSSTAAYAQLRKIALKGLRANALAYKKAWDKKSIVLQNVPKHPPSLREEQERGVQDSDHDGVDSDDGDSVLQGTQDRRHRASGTQTSYRRQHILSSEDEDDDDDNNVLQGTRHPHHIASATHESNSPSLLSLSRKRPLSYDGQNESNSNKRQCSHRVTRKVEQSLQKQYTSPEEALFRTQGESSRSRNPVWLNEEAGTTDMGETSHASIIVPILESPVADRPIATGSSDDPIQIEDNVEVEHADNTQAPQRYATDIESPEHLNSLDSNSTSRMPEAEDIGSLNRWLVLT